MSSTVRLFLCGDVMTGRGIDQILRHPCDPILYEPYIDSAVDYVRLAEAENGPLPRQVDGSYIWATALDRLNRARPDCRIINLETSITRSGDFFPKGINYRMSPENADCLTQAAIDCCVLANNHVMDWGHRGLIETLQTLKRLGIHMAGAGSDIAEASAPAVLNLNTSRVLVFAFALPTSGTPPRWASDRVTPGVNFLQDLSLASIAHIIDQVTWTRRSGDIVIVSIHWGGNWGYEIPEDQRRFAHELIKNANVSVIHGHSSHHPKAIEIYRNRPVLYGCGDFLTDYEGIRGYEEYRPDIALMYLADIDTASGDLEALEIVPFQIRRFQLIPPPNDDVAWVRQTLDIESKRFGTQILVISEDSWALSW